MEAFLLLDVHLTAAFSGVSLGVYPSQTDLDGEGPLSKNLTYCKTSQDWNANKHMSGKHSIHP